MIPYLIALTLAISCASIINFRFLGGYLSDDLKKVAVFLASFPLIFISTFRGDEVGTDTKSYIYIFDNIQQLGMGFFDEPLYTLSIVLIKSIFNDYHVMFLFHVTVILIFYILGIFKLSINKILSFSLFLFLGFFSYHINGARQAIALAIAFYAVGFIFERKIKSYILSLFIGFLFHKSILIMLPLYFVFGRRLTPKFSVIIILLFFFIAMSINYIVDFASGIDHRYSTYANAQNSYSGVFQLIFLFGLLFTHVAIKYFNRIRTDEFDFYCIAIVIATSITFLSVFLKMNPSGIMRLSTYFIQFSILSLPVCIGSFKNYNSRMYATIVIVFYSVVHFLLTTSSYSKLSPYVFSEVLLGVL